LPDYERDEERLEDLTHLASLVADRSETDFEFRRATGSLAQDIDYISNALRRDGEVWRMNRAFHSVHVPSFIAVVSMLSDIDDMKSISEDERHQLYSSIHRAAQLASSARERLEHSALTETQVEVGVLADYAPATGEAYKPASLFERTREGLFSASNAALDKAKTSIEALPSVTGALKDGVNSSLERANAVPILASNLQRTLTGTLSDNVTKPIGMRLKASGKALTHGAGASVGLGAMAAVLFPPLVPISAGAGILVALRSWQKEMQKAQSLNTQLRAQRIAELQAERKAALLQLTNGAPSLQMETDELSLTLNAETGEADALILKGQHAGRTWSDLSMIEKAETATYVAEGAIAILRILEIVGEDH